MNIKLCFYLSLFIIAGCYIGEDKNTDQLTMDANTRKNLNLLNHLKTDDLNDFLWMNEPPHYTIENGTLRMRAPEKSDFFVDPESKKSTGNAPLLYKMVSGDFVASALIKPNFDDIWNAGAMMVYIDSTHWIKFAFENSDATGKSIVTVVTKGVSDDANGVMLHTEDRIWLRIVRKGNAYSMHWSKDGIDYKMARLSTLPYAEKVKLGLEAQCPAGGPAPHEFEYFSLEHRTVENIREG